MSLFRLPDPIFERLEPKRQFMKRYIIFLVLDNSLKLWPDKHTMCRPIRSSRNQEKKPESKVQEGEVLQERI